MTNKERLIELRTRMDENILDMNNIVVLLEDPKYSDSSVLSDKFKELERETREMNEEYQKLKSLINDVA
ncbi:MAG TPA: hypothetical protein DCW90_06075 [Lachnospiraceae bacterium]|nr:hypothetical protein [uncultured Lachnoclostridium sp.]HAU85064.1 hypothetical protein [Lachnospiraceae bacterium]